MAKLTKPTTIAGVCKIRFVEKFNRYELDAGLRLGGPKKYRVQFRTKQEAIAHAELLKVKIRNEGLSGFQLSQEDQIDALNALNKAKEYKISLMDAVDFYANFHQSSGAEMTFKDLVIRFKEQLEENRAKGEGVSDRTLSDYRSRHKKLADQFGSISLASFSHTKHWIPFSRKLCKASRRYENHLRILFNFAVEKEYLTQSPMKGKLSKAGKLKKPEILNEDQWRNLLRTAIETEDELGLLAYVVLALYLGLRPESEIPNLSWKSINLKTKKLFIADDETGKSDLGRTLRIPENAVKLLQLCRKQTGSIISSVHSHRRKWDKLREQVGFIKRNSAGKITENLWVADCCRHTAASMIYAKTQSKEEVRTFLGHTNDVTMRHYVNHGENLDEEAERFFSFTAPP